MEGNQEEGAFEVGLLPPGSAQLLAGGFDLPVWDVQADARQVDEWQGSNDDLLRWLASQHGFRAGTAARYLRGLRLALRSRPQR
jgi:hypothetical protein